MTVWDALVGQDDVVGGLRVAAADAARVVARGRPGRGAMTHAWLFTGPPGSGRSVAARAFAAALQCTEPERVPGAEPGCGHCDGCHTALAGTHSDVSVVTPQGLTIGVGEARALVAGSARAPGLGRWQVVLVEDADRLTESAANALLKAVEEPPARGVWLLCAPTAEDVGVTIRSRCRLVRLRVPPLPAVAGMVQRTDGVDQAVASWAARAAQGHVGRARRLATDEQARQRRLQVLDLVKALGSVGRCYAAARDLVDAVKEDAERAVKPLEEEETAALLLALGSGGTKGKGRASSTAPRGSAGAVKALEDRQRSRATRTRRDAFDLALTDLAAFYRDVLLLQSGARVAAVHGDAAAVAAKVARESTPEQALRRIEAVLACGRAVEANVDPLLAVEEMALALRAG
jgi:DNA polymerase-3 subunit delta'